MSRGAESWLAVLSELHSPIDLEACSQNIHTQMHEAFVVKEVGHSFFDPRMRRWTPTADIGISQVMEKMGERRT